MNCCKITIILLLLIIFSVSLKVLLTKNNDEIVHNTLIKFNFHPETENEFYILKHVLKDLIYKNNFQNAFIQDDDLLFSTLLNNNTEITQILEIKLEEDANLNKQPFIHENYIFNVYELIINRDLFNNFLFDENDFITLFVDIFKTIKIQLNPVSINFQYYLSLYKDQLQKIEDNLFDKTKCYNKFFINDSISFFIDINSFIPKSNIQINNIEEKDLNNVFSSSEAIQNIFIYNILHKVVTNNIFLLNKFFDIPIYFFNNSGQVYKHFNKKIYHKNYHFTFELGNTNKIFRSIYKNNQIDTISLKLNEDIITPSDKLFLEYYLIFKQKFFSLFSLRKTLLYNSIMNNIKSEEVNQNILNIFQEDFEILYLCYNNIINTSLIENFIHQKLIILDKIERKFFPSINTNF